MAISSNNVRVNITVAKEEKEKLEKIAKEDKRSVSNLIAKIVKEYLENKKGE